MSIVVFDIETIKRPIPEEFKQGILDLKVRVDKTTTDPKKIWGKLKEKFWTQPEGAQPIAVGFGVIDSEQRKVVRVMGHQTGVESEMAEFVIDTLNDLSPKKLIGYNSKAFDFPKLEHLVRNSKNYLKRGIGKWDHVDLILEIPTFFNNIRPLKGSPVSACALYDIPKVSKVEGGGVEELWKEDQKNKTKKVLEYCLDDVTVTGELALKLSILRNLF